MAQEKKEMTKKKVVSAQLPTQRVRYLVDEEEQTETEVISVEEALTEILERLERIESRQKA